ncbi:MAG TPA: transporter substrate-binding domain-containing protein [Bradyrhizobium sp.]|jgi:polar amino acid transport system substrate-binding protein|nr:transporter substrate-binding domain-containing protein [Bradyrhizobium sp.]
MKAKIVTVALIAAAVLSVSPASADSIVLYGNSQQSPKAWLDGETPKGFVVEAAVAVLKRAGYDVTVSLLPFARAMQKTTEGGVMTGVFLSAERAKIYDYSMPLVSEDVVVAVAKGKEFPFEKAADLAGKKIGLQDTFFYGDEFAAAAPKLTLDNDSSPSLRAKKLSAGRVDAALFNPGKTAVVNSAKEAGLAADDLTVLPKPLAKLGNYLIVGKGVAGGAEALARINKAIASATEDGTLAKIMAKYEQ